jgi:Domain of Unknown Function (DUF1543)
MQNGPTLFMILLGCKPEKRNIEQHDIFFTIAGNLAEAKDDILSFWPDAGTIHVDAWRPVTCVDGHRITVVEKTSAVTAANDWQLFFVNLGGYKKDEFEEFHYKMVVVAPDKGSAIQKAKETAFFKHMGFPGATSHVDDKYGVDVDDVAVIDDILTDSMKQRFAICIERCEDLVPDELRLGYLKWSKF